MTVETYNKNIQALFNANQLELIQKIEEVDLEKQEECIVFDGKEQEVKVLGVKKNSTHILYNSYYDPYKEAEALTKHLDYNVNRSMITVIGVGMGYHLLEILKSMNEKSVILAIEQNPNILKTLFWYVDFSGFIEKGRILFELINKDQDVYTSLSQIMSTLFLNIYSIQTVVLPIMDLSYIKFSRKVLNYIADLRNTLEFSIGNDLEDTIDGVYNRIQNLPHVIKNPGVKQFLEKYKGTYKNKPAIIIASGPSLDKNIHLLKEAQGKALLLACDGSMESLKKHEITPDVVSSIERILLTYEAFYKGKNFPEETVLVAPAVVRPEIMNSFTNKTLSLFKNESFGNYFNNMVFDKGSVFSGACVAHQLMGIAVALEANPIILVGQDLAYSEDGISHTCEASVKEKVNLENVNLYVEDINGKKVPTTIIWKLFKDIYEQFISTIKTNCIDASEGGAYIKGTNIMPLKKVIDTYCEEEIPRFRSLVDSLEVQYPQVFRSYENSLMEIIKLAKKFYLLKLRSEKGLEHNLNSELMMKNGLNSDEELEKVYDSLDYIEEKIVKNMSRHPEVMMLFQYPITLVVREINKLGTEYTYENIQSNLIIHRKLLYTIIEYCTKIMKVLEEGFINLKINALNSVENQDAITIESIFYPDYLVLQQ
ncbi:MAG: motility associated factor glycosyltransferase family protein [Bacillota bacterium]